MSYGLPANTRTLGAWRVIGLGGLAPHVRADIGTDRCAYWFAYEGAECDAECGSYEGADCDAYLDADAHAYQARLRRWVPRLRHEQHEVCGHGVRRLRVVWLLRPDAGVRV